LSREGRSIEGDYDMIYEIDFTDFRWMRWPSPSELKHYFVGPNRKLWSPDGESNERCIQIYPEGKDLPDGKFWLRKHYWFHLVGHDDYGVFLHWQRTGYGPQENFFAKGDLNKLKLQVRTHHGDALPLGLFIPFDQAWLAVEDFMKGNGARSSRIEWLRPQDLPENTFFAPHEVTCIND
jgi:hypothetical protein